MEKNILFLIIIVISILCVLALVLGLVFGLRKEDDEDSNETGVLNSYDNTEELKKKYPTNNPTKIINYLESNIQNRLLTGFENWNRGFETWKAWGNILYTNESIYNVHGARLSLASYQNAMDVSLQQQTIIMGDFHNMLITGEFAAIHYDFYSGTQEPLTKSRVMEFVRFTDYGGNLGTRVVEGWGSTKDNSTDGLKKFQADKEKAEQEAQDNYITNYFIPKSDDLKVKYIIKNPTVYIDTNAKDILEILLNGFDSWNKGIESFKEWINEAYDSNAISSSLEQKDRTMEEYKNNLTELFKTQTIEKLYFENILIRDNWAALHYRFRNKTVGNDEKIDTGDRMEFFKFEEIEGKLKIIGNWIQ